jgi:drug/metabolite transporter (DMT)-like permease
MLLSRKNEYLTLLKLDVDKTDRKWVIIVVVFGCMGNVLVIAGLEYVYLALASVLNNTFPIFSIIVAYFMLRESLTRLQLIIIIFAFVGVVMMSVNSLMQS